MASSDKGGGHPAANNPVRHSGRGFASDPERQREGFEGPRGAQERGSVPATTPEESSEAAARAAALQRLLELDGSEGGNHEGTR